MDGGWGAADVAGNGTHAQSLLRKCLDRTAFLGAQVLSPLAFCADCDILLAVHSDCPPLVNVCLGTSFYHGDIITMDFPV